MSERTDICETCRYGELNQYLESIRAVDCKWGPDTKMKKANHWCWQWARKLIQEKEDDKHTITEIRGGGGFFKCSLCGTDHQTSPFQYLKIISYPMDYEFAVCDDCSEKKVKDVRFAPL